MIESLHISNYALIDSIDIDFRPGFNVITGETGAGKSIILGALALILGGRADSKAVRAADRKSVIEAVFAVGSYPDVKAVCEANDIDWDDSPASRLIMRREIAANGRSRAFVNDTPVTVSLLQELAMHLVDIHSQHQNLLLARPEFQLDIIDSLAGDKDLLDEYARRYQTLRQEMRRLKHLKAEIEKSQENEEFMRFQLQQLDELKLAEGEQEELEREREVQANMSGILDNLRIVLDSLSEGEDNAISQISQAQGSIYALESLLDKADDIPARLESLLIELQDIADTISTAAESLDGDPSNLEWIERRLSSIYAMQRRHKVSSVEELIAIRDDLSRKLDLLDNSDDELAAAEKSARRALALARETAAALTAARKEQAAKFADELKNRAVPLGMKNLQCEIAVEPADIGPTGCDKVEFRFSFNKNQPLMPVGNTASGGEISRLMLSVKSIIARHIQLPSLILDEIDTGVSGDVANRMGELMRDISAYSQVIAITHLPGVAARGETHYKVYKEDDEVATHTRISQLDDDQRVDELALMLSGDPADPAARANAQALLKAKNS